MALGKGDIRKARASGLQRHGPILKRPNAECVGTSKEWLGITIWHLAVL
jgi:hypothetical protein